MIPLWVTPEPLPWAVPSPLSTPVPSWASLRLRGGGWHRRVPLLALELIWAASLPGRAPTAALLGGGRLSMETAV